LADPDLARLWLGRRVGVRQLLAAYTGLRPRELRLLRLPGQKPCMAPTQPGPRFSVSASGGWMAAAFGQEELGLDMELVRDDLAWEGLAQRFFSADELAWVQAQPNMACQRQSFFQVWTRKEAQLKLRGLGLAGLESLRERNGLGRSWVEDLALPLPLCGSLSLERPPAWLRLRRWPSSVAAGEPTRQKKATMQPTDRSPVAASLSPP
jgi:hypothetical protein